MSLPTPDLPPEFGDVIRTPLLVRPDGLMRGAHGWMRLDAHGIECDPARVSSIHSDLQITSTVLLAALLEGGS